MARNLSGEANNEEISTFNQILSDDPELQQQYESICMLWQTSRKKWDNSADHEDDILNRLLPLSADEHLLAFEQQVSKNKIRKRTFWLIAACTAGIIFFILHTQNFFKPLPIPLVKVIESPNGSRVKTQLPDGSVVFLNAGSVLNYNYLSDTMREVTITGEGYFDIIRDEKRPFVVHADNIDIQVIGTRFTVRSYPDDEVVETTLIHGEVELKKVGYHAPIRMKPNQKISVSKLPLLEKNQNSGSIKSALTVFEKDYLISTIDSALTKSNLSEVAWIYNRLIFRGDKFDQLARKMERWFDVKIVFTDDHVKSLSFNGSFENETIDQALTALQIAEPFKFKINQSNEVFISSP
ncbi:MAG: FecR family protein [Chitinophagaceae bacterium]|nr:FecR family protein [Chitinophagaceae bacterium]